MIGNGVKVQIEGLAAPQDEAKFGCGMMPPVHELPRKVGIAPSGVLSEVRPLHNGIEAGKEGQTFVQGFGHDLGRPPDAPELESKQRSYGAAGWSQCRAGHARQQIVHADACQIEGKQEEAAKAGRKRVRLKVERLARLTATLFRCVASWTWPRHVLSVTGVGYRLVDFEQLA